MMIIDMNLMKMKDQPPEPISAQNREGEQVSRALWVVTLLVVVVIIIMVNDDGDNNDEDDDNNDDDDLPLWPTRRDCQGRTQRARWRGNLGRSSPI